MVVRAGLEAGERVVVTDLVPVIAGMPLAATHDSGFENSMRERALGLAP